MTYKSLVTAALLAAAAPLAVAPANAVTLQYTLTGNDLDGTVEFASFRIDDHPVILPNNFELGGGFRVKFLSGVFQYGATVNTLRDIQFDSSILSGGFIDLDVADSVGSSIVLAVGGPQLYSGSEATPTLLTGNFTVFDAFSGAPLSLSVAAVPEPAAWSMMVIGFGIVGELARRRQRVTVAA